MYRPNKKLFLFQFLSGLLLFIISFFIYNYAFGITPNPGHPWTEVGDGTFQVTGPTALRTYIFPDANGTILVTTSLSSTALGLTYNSATGVFSRTAGYDSPLTASTTNWNTFYDTPSSRITAGTGLSWSGNTLNSTASGGGTGSGAFTTGVGKIYNATTTDYVGIGTTTPGSTLTVGGNAYFLTNAKFGQSSATISDTNGIFSDGLNVANLNLRGSDIYTSSSLNLKTDGQFLLQTGGGNTRMTILNTGNIGIGTSTPLNTLAIQGDVGISKDIELADQITDTLTPPSNSLSFYGKGLAGRMFPFWKGPSGIAEPVQGSLFQNNVTIISPSATTNLNTFGTALTSVGTISHVVSATLGYQANFLSGATAGLTAGTSHTTATWSRGSAAGSNGFFFFNRLAWPDATYSAVRNFVGFSDIATYSSVVGADDPGGNYVGFQYSTARGDTTWQFVTKNNTTQGKTSTTLAFAANKIYDFYIFCNTQCTTINWRIDNITDGTTQTGSTSTNLPTATTFMRAGFQMSNVTAVARNIRMRTLYVESDN